MRGYDRGMTESFTEPAGTDPRTRAAEQAADPPEPEAPDQTQPAEDPAAPEAPDETYH